MVCCSGAGIRYFSIALAQTLAPFHIDQKRNPNPDSWKCTRLESKVNCSIYNDVAFGLQLMYALSRLSSSLA